MRRSGTLHPVEIKTSSHPGKDAVENFKALASLPEPIGHGAVIGTTERHFGLPDACTAHAVGRL